MLSDDKKITIEAEEQYRHEFKIRMANMMERVGSDISTAENEMKLIEKKFTAKLMEFLNSSVGVWFLSSVLVTGGAAGLQQVQHNYETKQKNSAQFMAYQFEIGNRIQNMKYFLRYAKTVGDAKVALAGVFESKFPINSEVKNISLSGLYFNLYQLIPGTSQDKRKEAMRIVIALEEAEFLLKMQFDKDLLSAKDKEILQRLVSDLEAAHLPKNSE